tara:strand:- start:4211 stop:4378 length:168 start_codon:yes stop_codon:yes gene_type:complete
MKAKIKRIKKALKQDMIDYNKGKSYHLHYTKEEINAIDNLDNDFLLYRGRLLNIK